MELAFVIDAVRRYFWVVILGALLGGAAAAGLQSNAPDSYESRGVLLLTPPVGGGGAGDSERYVAGQLAILRSAGLAEQVAEELGDDTPAAAVAGAVTFLHVPGTDVVNVVATTEDPELSQRIATTLIDTYFTSLEAQVAASQEPDIARLDEQLTTLRARLDQVDEEIQAAMAPHIPPSPGSALPTPEQLVPGLASERALLLSQLNQVQTAQTELSLEARLQVASEVVQEPTLPTFAIGGSGKLLVAAGLVAGSFLGLLGAVLLARLSPRLLGIRHAAEILQQPVIGSFPRDRTLATDRLAALRDLPPAVMPFVDLVCVRAEASARAGECLVVAVTGTQRRAGSTTLAAAMANRYAAHGSRVLLIDADARDPELTRLLAPDAPGILRLLELAPAGPNIRAHADGAMAECFRRTNIPNLQVLGFGDRSRVPMLRRQSVATLLDVAQGFADVVVVDCGALMDAASSVQFATVADAVVLAVPNRQRTATLEVVARQLRERRGGLLPVWMPAGRRSRSGSAADPKGEASLPDSGSPGATMPGLSEAIQRARAHVEAQDDPGLARSGSGIRFQGSPRHQR